MRLLKQLCALPLALLLLLDVVPKAVSAQTIIGTLPFTLQNASVADANQVMSDFNTIVSAVNANAANAGANSNITALNGLTTPLSYTAGGSSLYIGGTSSGSANAYVVASPVPTGFTLVTGKVVNFTANFSNTGPTQLNVNGTGLTNFFRQTPSGPSPMGGGEIQNGQLVWAQYDGTQFECLNCQGGLVPPCTVIDWVGAGSPGGAGPVGYIVATGQAVSRASFPALFACEYVQGVAATTTNGSTSVVVPNSALFQVGWFVGGNNVTCNTTITAIPDGTHITLGAVAGASGATTLTIGPYPEGDCSTTFGVPLLVGRMTAMLDLNNGIISTATCSNPNSLGASCGAQTQTLTLGQLPTGITSSGSNLISVCPGAGGGSCSVNVPGTSGGSISNRQGTLTGTTDNFAASSLGNWTSTGPFSGNNTISVTSNNTSGAAHPILPPVSLVYKYIKF